MHLYLNKYVYLFKPASRNTRQETRSPKKAKIYQMYKMEVLCLVAGIFTRNHFRHTVLLLIDITFFC